jgi:hypothetical protein
MLRNLNNPIRPRVKWQNARAHKLAKHLAPLLNHAIQLPSAHNVQNACQPSY